MAMGRALIDVERVEFISRFNKEQVVFNVFEAMKHTHEDLQCYQIDLIDVCHTSIFTLNYRVNTYIIAFASLHNISCISCCIMPKVLVEINFWIYR